MDPAASLQLPGFLLPEPVEAELPRGLGEQRTIKHHPEDEDCSCSTSSRHLTTKIAKSRSQNDLRALVASQSQSEALIVPEGTEAALSKP